MIMKMTLRIFFSWQTSSKTDRLNNKKFILECIYQAKNEIKDNGKLKGVDFEVQEGTSGVPGSPEMIRTCLERNDKCHIFIADISVDKKFNRAQKFFNQSPALRVRPNENVVYELGRAEGRLDYRQVIHVANTIFGDMSKDQKVLPADLQPIRWPITFCLSSNDDPDADEVKKGLVNELKEAIAESALAAIEHIDQELLPYENVLKSKRRMRWERQLILKDNLEDIQKAIAENKGILRLLGVSGVGKTRMAVETLVNEQSDSPKLYCDCLLTPDEQRIIDTTKRIFEGYGAAILILDNCNADLFGRIKTLHKRLRAGNRVYAISNNKQERRDNDCNYLVFSDVYESVVDEIITAQYGQKNEVAERIKTYACGNPLRAVQAIDGVRKQGDLRDFTDEKLMDSLLMAPVGSDERVIAESLALFATIGYDGDAHRELEVIAANKNITSLSVDAPVLINKFDAIISLYIERGLMQKVGSYIRFRSPDIVKLLVTEWFEVCTKERLKRIITSLGESGMREYLLPSFFETVGMMTDNVIVMSLFTEMLKSGGLLVSKGILNTEVGAKIYCSLIEVVPDAVTESLFQILGGLSIEELKQIRDGRRELVWTLEKLCYRPESFRKAAKLMLRLGCAENEFVSNNASGQFVSLFPVRLPSTLVSLNERLEFLRKEINSEEEKPLIMKALNRALATASFIHFGREKYFEPESDKEIDDYLNGCLDLVEQEIDDGTAYKDECIKMLAGNFRALNVFGAFNLVMPRVEKVADLLGYEWDEMLRVLHFANRDPETKRDSETKVRIEALIKKLTKTDFATRFASVESFEQNDFLGMSNFERQQMVDAKYEALAEEMASKKLFDADTLRGVYQAFTYPPYSFAKMLAVRTMPEDQVQIATESIDLIGERGSSIFAYFVKEMSEEGFEEVVARIEEKGKNWLLFSLMAVRNYDFQHPYIDKLFKLVEKKEVSAELFVTYWDYVRIDRLSTPEAVELLERVMALKGGFEVALHMAMSQYLSSEHNNERMDGLMEREMMRHADKVAEYITNPHYSHILSVLLSKDEKQGLASALASGIFESVIASDTSSLRYEVESVLQRLFENYFDVTWKVMSDMMTAEKGDDNFAKFFFAFGFSTLHNPFPALIFRKEHEQMLMDWCGKHQDEGPYKLMSLAPLTDGDSLSDIVMMLLDSYGSQKMVRMALSDKLGSFAGPVSTYDDRAKLIEPLKSHKNLDVSTWAELEIARLKQTGEQTRKIEENFMIPGRLPSHRWTLKDEEDEEI